MSVPWPCLWTPWLHPWWGCCSSWRTLGPNRTAASDRRWNSLHLLSPQHLHPVHTFQTHSCCHWKSHQPEMRMFVRVPSPPGSVFTICFSWAISSASQSRSSEHVLSGSRLNLRQHTDAAERTSAENLQQIYNSWILKNVQNNSVHEMFNIFSFYFEIFAFSEKNTTVKCRV